MGITEIILVAIGISLDAAGVMICLGATMPEIRGRTLARMGVIIAPWQVVVLLAGSELRHILPRSASPLVMGTWAVLAALIFLGLGIYMFVKAGRREVIYEYRRDALETRVIFFTAVALSLDDFFAGIGMGLMDAELAAELIAVLIASVAAVIGGMYLGYYWGVEQRNKAYTVSGTLLCIAGLDVLIRYLA